MKPSWKLCVCHLKVEEVADVYPQSIHHAKAAVKVMNDKIVADTGGLDGEFWFLSQQIKSGRHIIIETSKTEYHYNDPIIQERLSAYFEQPAPKNRGTRETGKRRGRE